MPNDPPTPAEQLSDEPSGHDAHDYLHDKHKPSSKALVMLVSVVGKQRYPGRPTTNA